MATQNLLSKEKAKDIFAGLIVILFISYLGFTAYKNFTNQTSKTSDQDTQQQGEIISGTSTRAESEVLAQELGSEEIVWTANDYNVNDINPGTYEVKYGDTLWEIAEGVYGDGTMWTKILDANNNDIGFLPNGQQALIYAGQTLVIPN